MSGQASSVSFSVVSALDTGTAESLPIGGPSNDFCQRSCCGPL